MIWTYDTNWVDNRKPYVPTIIETKSDGLHFRMRPFQDAAGRGFPKGIMSAGYEVAFHTMGDFAMGKSAVYYHMGHYSNMCKAKGNALFSIYFFADYNDSVYRSSSYTSKWSSHITGVVGVDGASGKPGAIRIHWNNGSQRINYLEGAYWWLLVAMRPTDLARLTGSAVYFRDKDSSIYDHDRSYDFDMYDKDYYGFVRDTGKVYDFDGQSYPIYLVGVDVTGFPSELQYFRSGYVEFCFGLKFSQISSNMVYHIIDEYIALNFSS